jgi:hypothetical protein
MDIMGMNEDEKAGAVRIVVCLSMKLFLVFSEVMFSVQSPCMVHSYVFCTRTETLSRLRMNYCTNCWFGVSIFSITFAQSFGWSSLVSILMVIVDKCFVQMTSSLRGRRIRSSSSGLTGPIFQPNSYF